MLRDRAGPPAAGTPSKPPPPRGHQKVWEAGSFLHFCGSLTCHSLLREQPGNTVGALNEPFDLPFDLWGSTCRSRGCVHTRMTLEPL